MLFQKMIAIGNLPMASFFMTKSTRPGNFSDATRLERWGEVLKTFKAEYIRRLRDDQERPRSRWSLILTEITASGGRR